MYLVFGQMLQFVTSLVLAGGYGGDIVPPPGKRGGWVTTLADAEQAEVRSNSDWLSSVSYFIAIITEDHRLCWPGCKRKLLKVEQTLKL